MEDNISNRSLAGADAAMHAQSVRYQQGFAKFKQLFNAILWCSLGSVATITSTHAQEVNTAVLVNTPELDHRSLSNSADYGGIQSTQAENLSEAQLAQMLAPIALYPDTLLTHILIASTYPLELVQAQRWWQKHPNASNKKIEKAMQSKGWSPSVAALVPFPKVIERLNEDLDWTQQLGDAFLDDETRVLASIQKLRRHAKKAGSLDEMDNLRVSYDDRNIVIQPIKREVVYVPYYDTRVVYGDWYWHRYPPIYWARPHAYYTAYHRPFYWHRGVHISFNFFFGAFHWRDRHVVVINHYNTRHYKKRRAIISSHGAKRWHHKPVHRRGVAYRTVSTKQRYHSNRPAVVKANSHYRNKVVKHGAHKVKSHQYANSQLRKNQARQHQVKERKSEVRAVKTHKQRVSSVKNKLASERKSVHRANKHTASSRNNHAIAKHETHVSSKRNNRSQSNYSKPREYQSADRGSSRSSKNYQSKSYQSKSHSSKSYSNKARQSNQRVARAPSSSQRSHSGSRSGQSRSRDKH